MPQYHAAAPMRSNILSHAIVEWSAIDTTAKSMKEDRNVIDRVLRIPGFQRGGGSGAGMPRFFFHTQTEIRFTDVEGVEYPGYVEARQAAIRTCGQMMKDAPEIFWNSRPWSVTVTDATGLILWDIFLDGQSSAAGRSLEPVRPHGERWHSE